MVYWLTRLLFACPTKLRSSLLSEESTNYLIALTVGRDKLTHITHRKGKHKIICFHHLRLEFYGKVYNELYMRKFLAPLYVSLHFYIV